MDNPTEPCRLIVHGKGNRERVVLIPPKVMKSVLLWIEYILGAEEGDKLFKISTFSYWFHLRRVGEQIGIKLNPHLIRHTKASQLRNDGFDLVDIKNFLGHSDISTTQIYLHQSQKETLDKFRDYILGRYGGRITRGLTKIADKLSNIKF